MSRRKTADSTVAMKGGGYYSLHTQGAKDVIDRTTPLAIGAVAAMDVESGAGPFAMVDYGAADGGTSVDMINALVTDVRRRHASRPVSVTYTDLPRNDFSVLFTMLHSEDSAGRSYLSRHDDVFAFAAGTSFYLPIFPPGSIDLGFSATAMHWLSELPGPITDHVHAVGARGDELAAFRAQALRDWETILLHRAREMKADARLVMANFCMDEAGRYLGNTGGVNMFDTFNRLWRDLMDAGAITETEYQRTAFPQFYKTIEEFCAPLTDAESPVHQAGLRLVSAHTGVLPCPYAARRAKYRDPAAFAADYVPTLRSWSETVFYNALDAQRTVAERQALVERFYRSYIDLVTRDPTGHAMDYVHTYMVIAKEAS